MKSRTKQIGTKTAHHTHRSMLDVLNKDPDFEYSFRPLAAIEQGGGQDFLGYEPVGGTNYAGETWSAPRGTSPRAGVKQMRFMDTILAKRPKETGDYFREEENERYNAQVQLVLTASKRAQGKLRQIDSGQQVAKVTGELKGSEYFSQRPGPTEKET